jgi:hypothetical protein
MNITEQRCTCDECHLEDEQRKEGKFRIQTRFNNVWYICPKHAQELINRLQGLIDTNQSQ